MKTVETTFRVNLIQGLRKVISYSLTFQYICPLIYDDYKSIADITLTANLYYLRDNIFTSYMDWNMLVSMYIFCVAQKLIYNLTTYVLVSTNQVCIL